MFFRGVTRGDAGMYVCFVTSPRGGFNYRPAYLTVIPSKIKCARQLKRDILTKIFIAVFIERFWQMFFSGTESLVNESPPVLILVICLSVSGVFILIIVVIVVIVIIVLIIDLTVSITRWLYWESSSRSLLALYGGEPRSP